MTIDDLKRVQQIDLEILLMVDKICKKHNIEYFLFYGTLLGAVRHKGPIPWDDDVDIAMTRENYSRFLDVAKKEIDAAQYEIRIMGSGSTKYISEIKIGKNGTTYCLPGTENLNIMNKVQLDIFCIDPIREMTTKSFENRIKIWNLLYLCKLNYSEKRLLKLCIDRSNKRWKLVYKIGLDILHIIRFFISEKNIEKIGYNMFVDKSKESNVLSVIGFINRWPKDYFKGFTTLLYEGYNLPVPTNFKGVLTNVYGDYMALPPKEKRLKNNFDVWVFKES